DPFNATNHQRIGPMTSMIDQQRNKSLYFDRRAAQYQLIFSAMEKRKSKHYEELIRANWSFCETIFLTAGAFTTGGLCDEFRELIQLISMIAQRETSGWDPDEVIEGVRGAVAVAIQEGNAWVVNDSWNRIAQRNFNRLLKPPKESNRLGGIGAGLRVRRSVAPIAPTPSVA